MRYLMACFILFGCQGMTQQDGTALVQGYQALQAEHEALANSFEIVAKNAEALTPADEAKKATLLGLIMQSRQSVAAITRSATGAISAMMRVNYQTLYMELQQVAYGFNAGGVR